MPGLFPVRRIAIRHLCGPLALAVALSLGDGTQLDAQDIISSQLRQGFGKNKVRYKDFDWWILESEHLELHYEPEFHDLAQQAIEYLEEAYVQVSEILRHDLSTKPPIVIYQSHYEFQQTNIIHDFLPPGVAGFAEPLRYRMVIPFNGDLDEFRNVLIHELCHIFQYDILYKGPIKRLSNPLSAPPTWIMEGQAEYVTQERNTLDEMVLRDAVLTDQFIPLELMNAAWGTGNVFLAYKQSHSLMEYIAANFGQEKISRILRVWDSQNDTDKLLERLIDMDMKTLHERWSAHMRKTYWPLLQSRDYMTEVAEKVVQQEDFFGAYASPDWSLSGDMLAVLSTDGVEQHVDIIRVHDASLVERVTRNMRIADYDHLTFGSGTVAWAPDGRTIAFVAKRGPKDIILLWDLYEKRLRNTLQFDRLEVIESLTWDPESRRLAFVGIGYAQADIYVVDVGTGGLSQLTGTPQRDDYPAWSPDGTQLAFSAKQSNQFDIRIYDLESGQSRVAVATATDDLYPQWLPEGNKILFVSTRDRINDLFVYHLEQDREYRLTRTLSGIMDPALSPDGRRVVFSTYYQGQRELYVMDVPDWTEIKRLDAEQLARAPVPLDSAQVRHSAPEEHDGPVTVTPPPTALAAAADSAALASVPTAPDTASARALALVDQAQAPGKVRLLFSSDSFRDEEAAGGARSGLPRPEMAADTSTKLSVGTLRKRRYTPKMEFDGLSLQMGYFDGFFSSIGQLSMSDLLGNHSVSLATNAIASQEIENDFNFAVTYNYYGHRPKFNVAIFNWNQFYNDDNVYLVSTGLARGIVRSRQTGMLIDASYPRDLYRRIDLSYTYVSENEERIWPEKEVLGTVGTHLLKTAFVHDSINYGLLGPTSGKRYFVSVGRTVRLSSDNRSFTHLELDYRHYLRLGRWSVLGLRSAGIGSVGPNGLQYNLGGPVWFLPFYTGFNLNTGPLRGYSFSEFSGSRVALINTELRVPFIRQITFAWPTIFTIPAVDGSLFLDIGGSRNEGEEIAFWPLYTPEPTDPNKPQEIPGEKRRLRAGVGFGLLVYFLLPMNFEFARQTDLQGNYSDYEMHFSFGQSF